MASERLAQLRAAFAVVNEEYKKIAAEVDELSSQEATLHKKQQDAVYVRNALSGSVASLRTAINNLIAIEETENGATDE